ncbi:DsbA family protein [Streptomyces cellulosae]
MRRRRPARRRSAAPTRCGSSHDAHRLLHLAEEHGGAALQNEVAEHVMKAHFVDGDDISSRRTLKEIAVRSGFTEGATLVDTDAGDREVREDDAVAHVARAAALCPLDAPRDGAPPPLHALFRHVSDNGPLYRRMLGDQGARCSPRACGSG